MISLFDIDFVTGHEYYGTVAKTWNSHQWLNKVRGDVVTSYGAGDEYDDEIDNLTIKLDDTDRHFRNYMDDIDNKHIEGREVIHYTHDGASTGTKRRTMKIYDWGFDPSDNTFILKLGFKLLKDQDFNPGLIEAENYPNVPIENIGKPIQYCYGYFLNPTGTPTAAQKLEDTVKAYRILDTPTGTMDYLIGKMGHDIELTWGATLARVFKPDGTDISGSCTFTKHTDGRTYVNYNATTEDYLLCHLIPISNISFLQLITKIMDDLGLTYDTSAITTLFDEEGERYFNRNGTTQCDYFRYIINSKINRSQVLKEICIQSEMERYVNENEEICFKAIKFDNLTPDHAFDTIMNFISIEPDSGMRENQIEAQSYKKPSTGAYESGLTYNNKGAQARCGFVLPASFSYPFGKYPLNNDDYPAFVPAKFRALRRRNTPIKVNIKVALTHISQPDGLDVKPLGIISFAHNKAITDTVRIYHVRRVKQHWTGNYTELDLYDIEDFKNYYTGFLTLIHSDNEAGSKQIFTSSPINSQLYIPAVGGDVRHSIGQKKFGATSIRFDGGASDVIQGDLSYRIEPFQYTDFVISCWIRRDVAGVGHAMMGVYNDANNYWRFQARSDNKLQYHFRESGADHINLSAGILNASTWYQCVFAKKGTDYGIYIDGVQVDYQSAVIGAKNMSGLLRIGIYGTLNIFNGYIDEIAVMSDNDIWGLAPNAGLTDTYTVPTKAFTDYGLN